jgi:hypothetical protein
MKAFPTFNAVTERQFFVFFLEEDIAPVDERHLKN